MNQNDRIPSPDLVEQYRRELLAMAPPAPPTDNWLDSKYPEPDISRDKETMAEPEPSASAEENPYVGYLRIFAFTGEGAEPLEAARVSVEREGILYANVTTDRDGFSPVISLPSVNPALTLTPGNRAPYLGYTVTVTADGYRGVRHENLPVYGDNYVTLPVTLLPLLPGENPDAFSTQVSDGPTNL